MKKHRLLPVLFFIFAGCQESNAPVENKTESAPTTLDAPAPNPASATDANTLQITEPCAIFYSPDSTKLEKIKKENGEEAFYTIADDNQNYLTDSRVFLESKGVKIVDVTDGIISFRLNNGSTTVINLNDEKYRWEALLFDGNALHRMDITDIESSYNK
ncbi:hypothetical protein [Chitinophaga sp. MM2321]|uniref:hypothetical protein n=1 Tax=Chitinophaga sp. MM2321 TaxID=3137178 RepID=UPI0032D595FC